MRPPLLRRLLVVVLIALGVGTASVSLPAQAAPASHHVTVHPPVQPYDWAW